MTTELRSCGVSNPGAMGGQVLRVEAGDLRAVDSVSAGDVAVAVGLSHAVTGDTLVAPYGELRGLQLDGVTVPPPVFSLAVEAESSGQQVWSCKCERRSFDVGFTTESSGRRGQLVVEVAAKVLKK